MKWDVYDACIDFDVESMEDLPLEINVGHSIRKHPIPHSQIDRKVFYEVHVTFFGTITIPVPCCELIKKFSLGTHKEMKYVLWKRIKNFFSGLSNWIHQIIENQILMDYSFLEAGFFKIFHFDKFLTNIWEVGPIIFSQLL